VEDALDDLVAVCKSNGGSIGRNLNTRT
jgi:hypothetical protein